MDPKVHVRVFSYAFSLGNRDGDGVSTGNFKILPEVGVGVTLWLVLDVLFSKVKMSFKITMGKDTFQTVYLHI